MTPSSEATVSFLAVSFLAVSFLAVSFLGVSFLALSFEAPWPGFSFCAAVGSSSRSESRFNSSSFNSSSFNSSSFKSSSELPPPPRISSFPLEKSSLDFLNAMAASPQVCLRYGILGGRNPQVRFSYNPWVWQSFDRTRTEWYHKPKVSGTTYPGADGGG